MTLVAAVVCPHPPLLVPATPGAAPPEPLRPVLDACDRALWGLLAAEPELIAVVGGGHATREYRRDTAGSLHPHGAAVTVGEGEPLLPLSLTIGRWLLDRLAPPPAVRVLMQAVDRQASPAACRELGREIAGRAERVALLAVGDASGRGAQGEPGRPDPQAQEYDDEVAEALAAADARWLGTLDRRLDDGLAVSGRAAWQVLAGAAAGARFHGRLLSMSAPYGVTHLVAVWDEPRATQA